MIWDLSKDKCHLASANIISRSSIQTLSGRKIQWTFFEFHPLELLLETCLLERDEERLLNSGEIDNCALSLALPPLIWEAITWFYKLNTRPLFGYRYSEVFDFFSEAKNLMTANSSSELWLLMRRVNLSSCPILDRKLYNLGFSQFI